MSAKKLPRVFIGSSTEALDTAYALQTCLEFDSEPKVWTQGIFQSSSFTLKDLVISLQNFDFAVFIFQPDDVVTMRDQSMQAVRDNVVFELGLFMGRLGIEKCFILKARGEPRLHLPTDLMGLQPLEFNADRSDKNVLAALGPAAHSLRGIFSKFQKVDLGITAVAATSEPEKKRNLERYLTIWNSEVLANDRQKARKGLAMNVAEDDTGQDYETVTRLLAFIETVCDAATRGELDSTALDEQLGKSIREFHTYAGHFFRNAIHGGDPWVSEVIQTWLVDCDKLKTKSL